MIRSPIRRARPALAVLSAVALASCAMGPDYATPSAPISATFKESVDKEGVAWAPAAPADALDRGNWWTLFGDPVLNDLASRVEVSNQNIIAAEAAYRQARALVSEQRSGLFPVVDVSGGVTRTGRGAGSSGATVVGGQVVTTNSGRASTNYRASLGGSWELDVWGRIRRVIQSARAQAQASEADLAGARLAAQGELAVNYFGLRQADTDLALDRATAAGYRRSLQIAQNRFNAGVAPHSDVLQAQTQLYNAQADLAGREQTRATYEHAIAVLVGEAPGAFSLAEVPDWTGTTPDVPPGVPSTLLQRRPDIAAAERRAAAASAEIGVAVAAWFPSLTLTGSYGFSSTALGGLFNASNALWSYGAQAGATLFDAGGRSARVRGARAAYDQSVAEYRQTVLAALQDVENQLIASRVLAAQYALRRDASIAADAAERMVANRYQAGQVSYAEVVTAQASAYAARSALAQAAAQRQTTAVALIQSLGGGWRAPAP